MSFSLTEKDIAREIILARLEEARWWQEAICGYGDIEITERFDAAAMRRLKEIETDAERLNNEQIP